MDGLEFNVPLEAIPTVPLKSKSRLPLTSMASTETAGVMISLTNILVGCSIKLNSVAITSIRLLLLAVDETAPPAFVAAKPELPASVLVSVMVNEKGKLSSTSVAKLTRILNDKTVLSGQETDRLLKLMD